MSIIQLNEDSELEELISEKSLCVLYFSAKWCGPCKIAKSIIENFAKNNDKILNIIQIDVEKFSKLGTAYNITSLPTFVFYKDNKLSDKRIEGIHKLHEKFYNILNHL